MSRVFDSIRQVAYVTPDLESSMRFLIDKAGIGPWFVTDRVPVKDVTYRGLPLELEMTVALANSGTLQIELVQQTSSQASIYTEWLDRHPRGDVVHHFSSWTERYDEVYGNALRLGYEAIQEGRSDHGKFVYFQHPENLGFIYEVAELTTPRRRTFGQVADAAQNWDGRDPVRIIRRHPDA